MKEIYQTIHTMFERGEPGVLVTIIRVEGSVPRHAGSKMIVRADGSVSGTIGGGKLEADAVAQALVTMKAEEVVAKQYELNESNDMLCGGEAELLFEPFGRQEKLVIFGAGHIASALVPLGKQAGFRIVVVDNRNEFASAERLPGADEVLTGEYPELFERIQLDMGTSVVIVTHKHSYDEEVLRYCLDQVTAYTGMIGSSSKSARVLDNLRQSGVAPEVLNTVYTPVGLNIGAETPFEIAISILAEIIAVRQGIDTEALSMKSILSDYVS